MSGHKKDDCNPFSDIRDGCKDVINAQMALGREILNLCTDSASAAMGALGGRKLPVTFGGCDCTIPEPCWMPVEICGVTCQLCEGSEGLVRLIVTNEDYRAHRYRIDAAGTGAGLAKVEAPATATLGPKERRVFKVRIKAPANDDEGDLVLWVRGCRDYYVRVKVVAGKRHRCCHEIVVNDTPDYVVHWYDHFYCPRPCPGSLARDEEGG